MQLKNVLPVLATVLLAACATLSGPTFVYQNYPAPGAYRTYAVAPSQGPRHIVNADGVLLPFFREEMQAKCYRPAAAGADLDITYEVRVYIRRQVSQVPVPGADAMKLRATLDERQKGVIALVASDTRTGATVYTASIKGDVRDSITDEQLHALVKGLLEHLPPAAKE